MKLTLPNINFSLVIPWLLTVLTLVAGIWQFSVKLEQSNRQPFLQKQLELGCQAVETVATLAAETDPAQWEKARVAFWRLYLGPLSIVEDGAVGAAMGQLALLVPAEPSPTVKLPFRAIESPSHELARAVRSLLLKSWNVDLATVTRPERAAR